MNADYLDLYQFLLKTNLDGFKIKNRESIQLKVERSSYNYDRYLGVQYENALKRIIELKFNVELKSIKNLHRNFIRRKPQYKFHIMRDIYIRKIKDTYLDFVLNTDTGIVDDSKSVERAIIRVLELLQEDYKDGIFTKEEYKVERTKLIDKLKDKEFSLNYFLFNYDPISEYKRVFKSDDEKNAFKSEIDILLRKTKFTLFDYNKVIYSNIQLNNSAHSIDFIIDNKLIDIKTSILNSNIKLDYKVQLLLYYIFYLRELKNLKEEKIHIPQIEYLVLYYVRYSYWHKIKIDELFCTKSLSEIVKNIKSFSAKETEKIIKSALKTIS